MKKIFFLLFVCLSYGAQSQKPDYYPPSSIPDRIILNVTEDPAEAIAITWRTAIHIDSGFVQIALADPSPDLIQNSETLVAEKEQYISETNGANYFSVVVRDLEPETMYAYRVGNKKLWSEWAHFETASEKSEAFSFIYFGDAQNDLKSMWSRAIRGAFQQMPKANFLLHAGDLVNRRNNDHEWGEWYHAGGWIYQMIPSISTPGNHEYGMNKAGEYVLSKHWKPTFTQPENGPEGYEETAFYIDYQNTRIISIDAPAFRRSEADAQIQTAWLESLLQETDHKWKILTMHYPIYSTKYGRDNRDLRDSLQPLLEKYGVDIVLTGHDHTYGRGTNLPIGARKKNSLDGPIYVVSVSGPKMYDIGMDEWMQRGAMNTQLYQLIHIDENTLRFEAYTVDNKLYDAFELIKEDDGKNLFFDKAPEDVEERLELPPYWKTRYNEEQMEDFINRFNQYMERKKNLEQKGE